MVRVAICGLLVGCGPQVAVPIDEGSGSDTDASAGEATQGGADDPIASGLASSASMSDDGEGSAAPPAETGVDDDGLPPPDEPLVTLCDGDPYLVDPRKFFLYLECMRGLMTFSAHVWPDGEVGYDAYAQFYTVSEFSPIMWQEEIIDPWVGPYDCALARYGNSGTGGTKVVLWEDAGDVTFALGDQWVAAQEYGDPVSVIGYTFNDESFAAPLGQSHGLVATGDTTPAFDFPGVVLLPPPFEVLSPSLDAGAIVDGDAFAVTWAGPHVEVPVVVSLHVNVPGDWDYSLYCTGPDTGQLVVPPELVAQLPLPTTATLHLSRADMRLLDAGDGRSILATAATTTAGEITVQ